MAKPTRKSKTVTIDGTEYVISEIAFVKAMPIMDVIKDDPMKGQLQIFAAAVTVDGEYFTDAELDEIGMKTFMALVTDVMELNGLDAAETVGNG